MKVRIISIVVFALSMTLLAACGSPASGSNETVKDEEVVNMPNPWQETTDIEEAISRKQRKVPALIWKHLRRELC